MPRIFQIGERYTVKASGPYKMSDAASVRGRTGTIIGNISDHDALFQFLGWSGGHGDNCTEWYVEFADLDLPESSIVTSTATTILSADAKERKKVPLGTGVLDYFPAALAEIAKVSYQGNEQHNPGEPLHWARAKSADQADTMIRHFLERGTLDSDGQRHSAKMAWRALAILQLELEAEGAPIARGAK